MLIEVSGLHKSFKGQMAVNNANFSIENPTIVGLLGSNGAGKSTTMRMMAGILKPDSGVVRIVGHDIINDRLSAQSNLGYLPEAASGFSNVTALEFLKFAASAQALERQDRKHAVEAVIDRLDLSSITGTTLGTLSKGWRQRVWLAQALIHDPSVLILDEPTDGLDPNQKLVLRKLLQEVAKTTAIIMSTHILEEAENLCEQVIVMNEGSIVANLPTQDLLDSEGRLATAVLDLTTSQVEH
ncbi:MAG: ABC transporter ATP-binding protein [Hyphomicrobiales bacterium]